MLNSGSATWRRPGPLLRSRARGAADAKTGQGKTKSTGKDKKGKDSKNGKGKSGKGKSDKGKKAAKGGRDKRAKK